MKKKALSVFLATLLLGNLAACGNTNTGSATNASETSAAATANEVSDYTVRVNYSSSLCLAPLQVAMEMGFFEEEGINVEFVRVEAAEVPAAIGANKIDAGLGLVGKFLQQVPNGLPVKFTGGVHTGCIKILAPKNSGINNIADLKGKTIAVSGLAGAETLISKRALAEEGISTDERDGEVQFAVYAQSDMGQALENGSVDAIATLEPSATIYTDQYDLNVLLDTASSDGYEGEYCCDTFVTDKFVSEHPDEAAAFTRAVLKAAVYVQENPEETAQLQIDHNYVTGEVEYNAGILENMNYIPSIQGGYDAVKASTETLIDIGVLDAETDVDTFVNDLFVFFDDQPDSYTWDDISEFVESRQNE